MKKIILVSAVAFALAGCGESSTYPHPEEKQAEIAPVAQQIDHYYSMNDGSEYGYETAISQDAANQGQVAAKLMMFKFAGEKDNKFQVYSKENDAIAVAECTNPCDYIKVMTFYGGEHIKTERIRATEGNIGTMVIMDAINGKLEQYVGMNKQTGKKVNVWFTEQDGMIATPIK